MKCKYDALKLNSLFQSTKNANQTELTFLNKTPKILLENHVLETICYIMGMVRAEEVTFFITCSYGEKWRVLK